MALRQHIARLALLIALAALVQSWVISQAVVPSQDAVRYLASAQAMHRDGWWATVLAQTDSPLFGSLVYAIHSLGNFATSRPVPVSESLNSDDRFTWLLSLQTASAAGLILAIIPLYGLLYRWAGAQAAVFGSLLYSLLAGTARLGADGLSDSLQLLTIFAACYVLTCYWTGDQGRRLNSPRTLLACGVLLGVGMLAGSLPVAFLPAVACALYFDRSNDGLRLTHAQQVRQLSALAAGVVLVLGAYVAATCGGDFHRAAERLRAEHKPETASVLNAATSSVATPTAEWRLTSGEPMAFGHKEASVSLRSRGAAAAVVQFVRELTVLLSVPVLALALFGMWQMPRESVTRADRGFMWLVIGYAVVTMTHAARSGYLSERHLLPLLPWGLAWFARGVTAFGVAFERQFPWSEQWSAAWPRVPAAAWFSRCCLLVVLAFSLLTTWQPLHASRWGHRQAAEWLADATPVGLPVLDTRGWTALYSGRPTYRHEAASMALANAQLAFVVVEQYELEADSPRGRTLRELLARSAERVMCFEPPAGAAAQSVAVYRWHPDRFAALIRDNRRQ